MGIFDFIKNQFIEVIEWTDSTDDTIIYRFPVAEKEIKMGAQLTVRESQIAVFVNEGQIADIYMPGRYTLTTQNMPVLTKIKSWQYGFNSPFKAEVYFVNTKQFTDQKWGTANPIMMRDAEFGMLRLRAFGIFSFRVTDAPKLIHELSGTKDVFDTESIVGQLKRSLISGITDVLGEAKIPALDLAMNYDELSENAKNKLQSRFEEFGFQLVSLYIENISLPEEVEKVLDKRTSMGVLGNMQQYTQYQAAEAIRDAAQNPGSNFAGVGVGIGAGNAIGSFMAEGLKASQQNQQAPEDNTILCSKCNSKVPANSKFCSSCGNVLAAPKAHCIKCGHELEQGAKFCIECGAPQNIEVVCKKCGKTIPTNSKFCIECGTKVE